MVRDTTFRGESVKPSIDSIIRRLVKVGAGMACHHEGGMFMSRRLFLSPAAIASYSPEPQPALWGGGTSSSDPGKEGVIKFAKTSLIDLSLACLIGELYGFVCLRVVPEVFSGKNLIPKCCQDA
jgi:hypothetical protein